MVTNYTTKNYIKSGSENASRKLFILYIKSHIYTKFNAQKNLPFPAALGFLSYSLSLSYIYIRF